MTEALLRRLWIGAVLLLAAAIAVASLVPQALLADATLSDKLAHYLAYLALALLGSGISSPARLWRAMLRCFLFGASLEIAQGFLTAHRTAEWADLGANAAGVLTAWLIAGQGRAGWGLRAAAWLASRRAS